MTSRWRSPVAVSTCESALLSVLQADITTLEVDIIVSSAEPSLLSPTGCAAAIFQAAGPELREHCSRLPLLGLGVRCRPGSALLTPAFQLPARNIVHTVGPAWSGGGRGETTLLAECYRSVLRLAGLIGAGSVAFPALCCGARGFPLAQAALVAVATTREELLKPTTVRSVSLVAANVKVLAALQTAVAGGSGEYGRN